MNVIDEEARRNLHILDEVSRDKRISQRTLSERLGIALGCTNLCIKRLVKKGFIKIQKVPGKRYLYFLTPTGFSEKTALSIQYIQFSWRYYKEIREFWWSCFEKLKKEGVKRVVLFGTEEMAELAYLSLREAGLLVISIVNLHGVGSNFCGHQVDHPSILKSLHYDRVILASTDSAQNNYPCGKDFLFSEGVKVEDIVGLPGLEWGLK